MGRRFNLWCLCFLTAVVARAPMSDAATSATIDVFPGGSAGPAFDALDITGVKPIPVAKPKLEIPLPRGNPLWSVPLSSLTVTRERPIFSASRRPALGAVVAPDIEQPAEGKTVKSAEPETPPLALIGSVISDNDAVAVFLDRISQRVIRMRPGNVHAGWTLSEIMRREVTLKKADQTHTLALKRSNDPPSSAETSAAALTSLTAGGLDTSYAPFVPRHTPKNGESDGL